MSPALDLMQRLQTLIKVCVQCRSTEIVQGDCLEWLGNVKVEGAGPLSDLLQLIYSSLNSYLKNYILFFNQFNISYPQIIFETLDEPVSAL